MLGSVGFPELILIFFVALIVFGPKKLPEIGKSIGHALGEFRRATNELKSSLEEDVARSEPPASVQQNIQPTPPPQPTLPPQATSPPNPQNTDEN